MAFEAPSLTLKYGTGREASAEGREALLKGRLAELQLPTAADVHAKYPAFADATSVFVSGSLIWGWAHANSDLDLYVISKEPFVAGPGMETFERHISTADPLIWITLGEFGPFRTDIEIWREEQVDEIIGRFANGVPNQEMPEIGMSEHDMLHRLASGAPIAGDDWFNSRRDAIRASSFSAWLAEAKKLDAEGFLEDVAGLLASNDEHAAVIAAREAFNRSLAGLLALYGEYGVSPKWMFKRVLAAQPTEISKDEAWELLTMKGCHEAPAKWAEHAAAVATRLLIGIEEKTA
ncbi:MULTISPECIES: hypothetical protein [unclassified Kitasatospora]|uniref:hypothetical protein n=1 Tax=unclassified Kitasatospora TaxID=2633591 RepID=UPI0033C1359B